MTRTSHRATAHTEVKNAEQTNLDEAPDGPAVMEIRVDETFYGDIEGRGTARIVHAERKDGSASFAGIERVRGTLGGRNGTFLLQVNGTVIDKDMKAEWFVVPHSGTAELEGLRGAGGFTATLGKNGSVWLDYYFE